MKWPSIPYLPYSPTADEVRADKVLDEREAARLVGKGSGLVVTEKLDGETFSLYRNYPPHARSADGTHESHDFIKGLWSKKRLAIPTDWQVVGEYLFAQHSVIYPGMSLSNIFNVFAIIEGRGNVLSWADTIQWCRANGFGLVPELRFDLVDGQIVPYWQQDGWTGPDHEGWVVRLARGFRLDEIEAGVAMAKWVRAGHVQGDFWKKNWKPWNHRPEGV